MSVKPFPIKAAIENADNSLIPLLVDKITETLNERILTGSKEGNWYTDYFYTYWGYINESRMKEILTEVTQSYKDEGYYVQSRIEVHTEAKLTLYFSLGWGMGVE